MSQTLLPIRSKETWTKNTPLTLLSQRKLSLAVRNTLCVIKSLEHLKKFKKWPCPLFRPRTNYTCYQKPNPSREKVHLTVCAFVFVPTHPRETRELVFWGRTLVFSWAMKLLSWELTPRDESAPPRSWGVYMYTFLGMSNSTRGSAGSAYCPSVCKNHW